MKRKLILGIGNLLMGDEGIGIHIVRRLQEKGELSGVDIVDGGTGGFHLLEYFQNYEQVILVDATLDGQQAGTVTLLRPKYSSDYPTTLSAHDIGLKSLLDALTLLEIQPEIALFAVSIPDLDKLSLELSPEIEGVIKPAAERIMRFCREG